MGGESRQEGKKKGFAPFMGNLSDAAGIHFQPEDSSKMYADHLFWASFTPLWHNKDSSVKIFHSAIGTGIILMHLASQ